jgi:hypothetical protein
MELAVEDQVAVEQQQLQLPLRGLKQLLYIIQAVLAEHQHLELVPLQLLVAPALLVAEGEVPPLLLEMLQQVTGVLVLLVAEGEEHTFLVALLLRLVELAELVFSLEALEVQRLLAVPAAQAEVEAVYWDLDFQVQVLG